MFLAAFDWPVVSAMVAVAGVLASAWRQEQEAKRAQNRLARFVEESMAEMDARIRRLEGGP